MSFSKCYYLRPAPVVTAKPPRHAAYDATLTERRAKLWAGAYRPIRKQKHPIYGLCVSPDMILALVLQTLQDFLSAGVTIAGLVR
jgi:hypothetical protein